MMTHPSKICGYYIHGKLASNAKLCQDQACSKVLVIVAVPLPLPLLLQQPLCHHSVAREACETEDSVECQACEVHHAEAVESKLLAYRNGRTVRTLGLL